MLARLLVESGNCVPLVVDLSPGQPVTIGRSRDNSLVCRDELVSRLHAKIFFDEGRWVVRDFGMNGTRLDGNRVPGTADLENNSLIEMGDARIRFTVYQAAETDVSSPHSNTPTDMTVERSSVPTPTSIAGTNRSGTNGYGETKGTKVHSHLNASREAAEEEDVNSTQLRVDELTALCRYMTSAMAMEDQHELIRHTLRTILNQTTASVAGYLGLDPGDPTPRLVLPEQSAVDTHLSRRLTEKVRQTRKRVWLFGDDYPSGSPGESLSKFNDAVCLPVAAGPGGEPYAALHVYRTGRGFTDRDMSFLEACASFLTPALEAHRTRRKLQAENSRLRGVAPVADEIIGESDTITHLRQRISKAAQQPTIVLIEGESGSGKELVAQALHRFSPRANGPLVVVNCAAIAPTLLEAELFGYRKGAFSGADRDHPGLFEQADEGTLFLDEVGELSLDCQAKLLRIIEGKPFRPVGGVRDVKVDVRLIAATHRNLEVEVGAGRFRHDLLYRLKVISLRVPPLREHPEDIPELASFFLERLSKQCRRSFRLTPAAMQALQSYPWPGNVRHLRAALESAAVMSETDVIDISALPLQPITTLTSDTAETASLPDTPDGLDMESVETWAIQKALQETNGNVSQAAKILGVSRDTLHSKMKKKGIDRTSILQGN